ncbi:hypothetical protein TRVA0_058S00100 [Trichomonascus vanleenenianus]|uniref:uncharacterized protein n=1 Tax=Trichomonascus vanleenenianus TaxID=2268995 RepID=UPI003ECA7369
MPTARPFISFLFGNLSSVNSSSNNRAISKASSSSSSSSTAAAQKIPCSTTVIHDSNQQQPRNHQRSSSTSLSSSWQQQPSKPQSIEASNNSSSTSIQTAGGNQGVTGTSPGSAWSYNSASERRNSNSSLSGTPTEKWWIGGRSSDGHERYYRLQPLTRHRSFDRISLDQLSI